MPAAEVPANSIVLGCDRWACCWSYAQYVPNRAGRGPADASADPLTARFETDVVYGAKPAFVSARVCGVISAITRSVTTPSPLVERMQPRCRGQRRCRTLPRPHRASHDERAANAQATVPAPTARWAPLVARDCRAQPRDRRNDRLQDSCLCAGRYHAFYFYASLGARFQKRTSNAVVQPRWERTRVESGARDKLVETDVRAAQFRSDRRGGPPVA